MDPILQEDYYHKLAPGRKSYGNTERGQRFSLTFRKIKNSSTTNCPDPPTPPPKIDNQQASQNLQEIDCLVFGSSLVKGLDEEKLSEGGKSFKVFTHGGAHINQICANIKKVKEDNKININMVRSVYLVCGGNDLANHNSDDLTPLFQRYTNLLITAKETFPHAKINAVSLIPRKVHSGWRGSSQIKCMHEVNDWLKDICNDHGDRYVQIFSFFINQRTGDMIKKLFKADELHFSNIGDSVLGKVLMAVA